MALSRRARRALLAAAGILLVALALIADGIRAKPLPLPAPFAGPLPAADPPAGVEVFALPTGVTHRSAAFAYRGGSFSDKREFSMAAALVTHPRGDLLIDTGFGRDIARQFALMPAPFRAVTSWSRGVPAADQLDAAGYDRRRLRGVLLTHAHWDHVSGVQDFPGTPILVTRAERAFVDTGGAVTVVARDLTDPAWEIYGFESGPYLGFPASHDVWGDGAIVVAPAPGHTPGSVIVFVTTSAGRRWAFVGDLVWQLEGVREREERPWPWRVVGDDDADAVRENLLRVSALAQAFPELVIVPSHDARGFAAMPRFGEAR